LLKFSYIVGILPYYWCDELLIGGNPVNPLWYIGVNYSKSLLKYWGWLNYCGGIPAPLIPNNSGCYGVLSVGLYIKLSYIVGILPYYWCGELLIGGNPVNPLC